MRKMIALFLGVLMTVMLLNVSAMAANEEVTGTIMIYTSIYQDVLDMMVSALKEEFPNLTVDTFYGGTGTIQTKLTAEMESGSVMCDMLLVAEPAYSLELKELGYLHPYVTENAANLRFDYDAEGYWYPVRVCNMVLAYNPEMHDAADLPNSFYDFAHDERVKGAISMGNPLTSGTSMASAATLSDLYGFEYFEALGAQEIMVESGSVALTKLQTGECMEIMILEESVLKLREEDESELAVIYPTDGTILIPSTSMIISEDYAPNKNSAACEAVTDWLLSDAGQALILKGWMHSVLSTVEEVPFDSIDTNGLIENAIGIDWERCYKERAQIRQAFEEAVAIPQ